MKFISTNTVNGDRLEITSKNLDTGLILYGKTEDDNGTYSVTYGVNEIGNVCNLPFRVSDLTFYVKVTSADVYVTAIAEFGDDDEYARYEDYSTDGMIEFDVDLSDKEKIILLAFLLNELH